jgi:uncharacterized protein
MVTRALVRVTSLVLLGLVRLYQLLLSPLLHQLTGSGCRFHPSCSQYAMQAIREFGPLTGVALTARRLSRCHPFHPGGYDPPIRRS